jgi:hypothetical protein
VVPWLVEYAAVLTNRFEVGKDGKTSFERNKGRAARTLGHRVRRGGVVEEEADRRRRGEVQLHV